MKNDKLQAMVGKTYLFMGNEYVVEEISRVNGSTDLWQIKTDKKIMKATYHELLNDFLEVESSAVMKSQAAALQVFIESQRDEMSPMMVVLQETIDKVKLDKGYVDQAKAINEIARTAIDARRMQIEAMRLVVGK